MLALSIVWPMSKEYSWAKGGNLSKERRIWIKEVILGNKGDLENRRDTHKWVRVRGIKSIMHFLDSLSDLKKITLFTISFRFDTVYWMMLRKKKIKNPVETCDFHISKIKCLLIYKVCLNITLGLFGKRKLCCASWLLNFLVAKNSWLSGVAL